MDKLKINLIPPEIKEKAKKEAKRTLVIRISIGLLGLLILLTSGVLALIIFEAVLLRSLNRDIDQEKTKIEGLKDKETAAFFLKNRINTISKYSVSQFTQSAVFELMESLFPDGVNITTLQIDKSNKVVIQGDSDSSVSLDQFFTNLTDPQMNEGKIGIVHIDSLSKTQTGNIRFSMNVSLTGK